MSIITFATEKSQPVDQVIKEVINSRLSMNKSFKDCVQAVTTAVLGQLSRQIAMADKADMVKIMQETLNFWKDLFLNFTPGEEEKIFNIDCVQVAAA